MTAGGQTSIVLDAQEYFFVKHGIVPHFGHGDRHIPSFSRLACNGGLYLVFGLLFPGTEVPLNSPFFALLSLYGHIGGSLLFVGMQIVVGYNGVVGLESRHKSLRIGDGLEEGLHGYLP